VRMRNDHRVDQRRIERRSFPVAFAELAEALEQSAINKDSMPIMLDEVFGTGHAADRTVETYACHPRTNLAQIRPEPVDPAQNRALGPPKENYIFLHFTVD